MLIVTYKALHDTGLGYLRKCLSLIVSAWPLWSCRVGILWIPLFKQCYLLWQHTFSRAVPALWNEVIPEIWMTSLLLFRRMIKIWFFTQSLWWGRMRHLTSFHLVMTLCLLWPREASQVCLSSFPCSILTQFVRLLLKADLHRALSTWEICYRAQFCHNSKTVIFNAQVPENDVGAFSTEHQFWVNWYKLVMIHLNNSFKELWSRYCSTHVSYFLWLDNWVYETFIECKLLQNDIVQGCQT